MDGMIERPTLLLAATWSRGLVARLSHDYGNQRGGMKNRPIRLWET
jgi:hypothetical protein